MTNINETGLLQMSLAETEWAERWVRDRMERPVLRLGATTWEVRDRDGGVFRIQASSHKQMFVQLDQEVADRVRAKLALVGMTPSPEWDLGREHPPRPFQTEALVLESPAERELVLNLLDMHAEVSDGDTLAPLGSPELAERLAARLRATHAGR